MQRQWKLTPEFVIAISAGFLLAYSLWFVPLMLARDLFPRTMDFVSFYTAAQLVLTKPAALYDLQAQSVLQQPIFYPFTTGGNVLGYFNTPFLAYFFIPLTSFSYDIAFWMFFLINGVIFLVTARLLNHLHQGTHLHYIAWILGGFAFFPTFKGILLGQNSILSLFILTSTTYFLLRRRESLAGRILALELFKPQLALLFVLLPLYKRRWKLVTAFSLVAVILVGVSFLPLGYTGVNDYVTLSGRILSWNEENGIFLESMQSWRGVFYFFLRSDSMTLVNTMSSITSALTILLCLVAFTGKWQLKPPLFRVQWSLAVLCALLATPHAYNHDLTLLLLPAALLVAHGGSRQASETFVRLFPILGSVFFVAAFVSGVLPKEAIMPVVQPLLLLSIALCLYEVRRLKTVSLKHSHCEARATSNQRFDRIRCKKVT
ncbi:MAG: DUF2029 domain-containing protein [Ardenticatenaceae bacterium]|nr:DUF2029 domain-containing protein [Ardenticatenaceae bacterium]